MRVKGSKMTGRRRSGVKEFRRRSAWDDRQKSVCWKGDREGELRQKEEGRKEASKQGRKEGRKDAILIVVRKKGAVVTRS